MMVAVSANAAITVTHKGEAVENGGEIVLTGEDFEYMEYPEIDWYQWSAEVTLDVECAAPCTAAAEATDSKFQFCPGGNCLPWSAEAPYVASNTVTFNTFNVPVHYQLDSKELPVVQESMVCTFTDTSNEPFKVTIKIAVDNNGVNEIMASSANIAGIYDLQGRRVRDDYRGVAIVVYDNGKAVKQVIK